MKAFDRVVQFDVNVDATTSDDVSWWVSRIVKDRPSIWHLLACFLKHLKSTSRLPIRYLASDVKLTKKPRLDLP